MIEIIPLNGSQSLHFENYDQLFDYIVETENMKLLSKRSQHAQIDWSFSIYPPKQVTTLYTYSSNLDDAISEAYEEGLPLIEICAGNYKQPTYIVNTPNVDLDYLRRKWSLDFCTYYDLIVKDYSKIFMGNLPIGRPDRLNV